MFAAGNHGDEGDTGRHCHLWAFQSALLQRINFFLSIIHPVLQLFAAFEKRQFFRGHLNGLTGSGISTLVRTIFFDKKRA
jgi:hypothetical protein